MITLLEVDVRLVMITLLEVEVRLVHPVEGNEQRQGREPAQHHRDEVGLAASRRVCFGHPSVALRQRGSCVCRFARTDPIDAARACRP